ncbi:metal ABC transporter permease [Candidatus Phytoplasma palmae]|uniref:metal ABC transporter permease n=1 Tax=Candidatus Phytoplasma palmae TaxID=85624 RepID=UPI003990CC70
MNLNLIINCFTNYTVLKIFLGTSLLGFTSGILGVFIILKKKDLLGDTLSHAILPGIAISYIYFKNTSEWVIWIGAFGASIISLFLIEIIKKYSKIKSDTILSLILASFFGLGNILIAFIQKENQDSSIAILEKFILGQTALISKEHVLSVVVVAVITFILITFLWKEIKIFIFDEFFAKSLGFNNIIISLILNTLLIGVIVISLKMTGIILTSAFLIMPGVISRQISDKLFINACIASSVTFFSSFIGILISLEIENMPTGPIIIIITTIFIFITCLFSNKHGILKKYFKNKKYKNKIKKFKQLIHLYNNNENINIQNIEPFLFEQKYLYLNKKNKKIIIKEKGIKLIENLINGSVK